MYSIKAFIGFNLQDLDDQILQNQLYYEKNSSLSELGHSKDNEAKSSSQQSIENFGNISNSSTNINIERQNLKQSENTTILVAKSNKIQETQIVSIFKRIYQKIVSSYLKQISWQQKKATRKTMRFQECDFYTFLQLQNPFLTVSQIINRIDLEFSQRSDLLCFLERHKNLKLFLTESLSNGFQEINNQFVYIVNQLIKQLRPFLSLKKDYISLKIIEENKKKQNQKGSSKRDSQELIRRRKSITSIQKEENAMKKLIEESSFMQKVFYDKRIKYLNCQQITSPVSDQKVQKSFVRFIRLYSHMIIKFLLIGSIEDQSPTKNPTNKSQSEKQSSQKIHKSCDIIGNWFIAGSCAKSFNSINSLGSINLNNLNEVKIYNSKPDLWSDDENDESCQSFSDDEFEGKKKRKY